MFLAEREKERERGREREKERERRIQFLIKLTVFKKKGPYLCNNFVSL